MELKKCYKEINEPLSPDLVFFALHCLSESFDLYDTLLILYLRGRGSTDLRSH